MATWQEYDNKGGVLKWKECNDTLFNNGEDFVCYALYPIKINMDIVVGEVECLTYEEYHEECPYIKYSGD